MVVTRLKSREDFTNRTIEPLDVRRKRQSDEAEIALKEYREAQIRTFERMIELRRQRLAQLKRG